MNLLFVKYIYEYTCLSIENKCSKYRLFGKSYTFEILYEQSG